MTTCATCLLDNFYLNNLPMNFFVTHIAKMLHPNASKAKENN